MFQFPGLSPSRLCVRREGARTSPGGFAHSETRGSKGVCPSPRIIAACRVLHRLHVPRHPPCALDIFPHDRAGRRIQFKQLDVWVSHTLGDDAHRRSSCNLLHMQIGRYISYLYIEESIRSLSLIRLLSLCGSQGTRGLPGDRTREDSDSGGDSGTPAP